MTFERYWLSNLPILRRLARALTRNPQDAEDAVQLAAIAAIARFDRWDREIPFYRWAYQVMRHQNQNTIRRNEKRRTDISLELCTRMEESHQSPSPEQQAISAVSLEHILQVTDNPIDRIIVERLSEEGENYHGSLVDIARETGKSIRTIEGRIYFLRKKLRARYTSVTGD